MRQLVKTTRSLFFLFYFKALKDSEGIVAEEFIFIFQGKVLKSNTPLKSQGIKKGSIIQVVKRGRKHLNIAKPWNKLSEREVQEIIWMYRTISPSNFHKASRPEFLKKVLEKYPIMRVNLSTISILKDPILLATLGNPDTVRQMADENHDLIDASKFIVDTLNSKSNTFLNYSGNPADDFDSSSSLDEPMASSSRASHRHIVVTQLTQALGQAIAGGTNSLANISQRNLSEGSGQRVDSGYNTLNSGAPSRITSSMFLNALSEVIQSTRSNNDVRNSRISPIENVHNSTTEATPRQTEVNDRQQHLYLAELQIMRDMGLTNTELCLQALILCNGDLEPAINLVLSGRGIN